jgi:hypothetical protein
MVSVLIVLLALVTFTVCKAVLDRQEALLIGKRVVDYEESHWVITTTMCVLVVAGVVSKVD